MCSKDFRRWMKENHEDVYVEVETLREEFFGYPKQIVSSFSAIIVFSLAALFSGLVAIGFLMANDWINAIAFGALAVILGFLVLFITHVDPVFRYPRQRGELRELLTTREYWTQGFRTVGLLSFTAAVVVAIFLFGMLFWLTLFPTVTIRPGW